MLKFKITDLSSPSIGFRPYDSLIYCPRSIKFSTESYFSFRLQLEMWRLTFQLSCLFQSFFYSFVTLFVYFSAFCDIAVSTLSPIQKSTQHIAYAVGIKRKYNSSKIICAQKNKNKTKMHFTRAVRKGAFIAIYKAQAIFTMPLRIMQRVVLLSKFCPSVCLSVCRSVRRVYCDKTNWRTPDIFIAHETTITLVFWHQQWLVGDALLSEICAESDPPTLRKTPTSTDFRA